MAPKGADEAAASKVVADPGAAAPVLNEAVGAWSGVTATPSGATPTGTVATTVLVAVSITRTLSSLLSATYASVPSGVTATPSGPLPVATVRMTAFVAVSITLTLLLDPF